MTNEQDDLLADVRNLIADKRNEQNAAQVRAWAEMDTWSVEEGLLLVSGIYPEGARVEWRGSGLSGVVVRNAWPLGERSTFLTIPSPTIKIGHVDELPGLGLTATGCDVDLDEQKVRKLEILRNLEGTLNRAKRLWVAGQHDDQRYPASYFVEWAKSKGISVASDLERAVMGHGKTDPESPDERRIRFAQMKKDGGKTDAQLAAEEGISRERARVLRSEGESILAKRASQSASFVGQAKQIGVAREKRKK